MRTWAPADAVSLARPVLGVALLATLGDGTASTAALPLVLAACLSDFLDGRLARRRGPDSVSGRLVDNLCDAAFLAMALGAMGRVGLWSGGSGAVAAMLPWFDALPVAAFASAFVAYLARMAIEQRRGTAPARSRLGHSAGVANYGLAIAGAVEAWPSVRLSPLPMEPAVAAVVAWNLAAVIENAVRMFPGRRDGPRMRA